MYLTVNKSTYVLLPLTRLQKADFPGFINCYMVDGDKPYISVLTNMEAKLPNSVTKSKYYNTHVEDEVENERYVILDLSEFEKEYELFKVGKYSVFSEKAKNLIKEFSGLSTKSHLLILALDKDERALEYLHKTTGHNKEDLRELEYYSSPYLEEETLS